MISIPCLTHCLTDRFERACAQTRRPRRLASLTAITISSSDIGDSSAPVGVIASPERLSLIRSTPYLMKVRTIRRMSSGPVEIAPKLISGSRRCGGRGERARAGGDPPNAVALQEHLAGEGAVAAAVEDACAGEQDICHGDLPKWRRWCQRRRPEVDLDSIPISVVARKTPPAPPPF